MIRFFQLFLRSWYIWMPSSFGDLCCKSFYCLSWIILVSLLDGLDMFGLLIFLLRSLFQVRDFYGIDYLLMTSLLISDLILILNVFCVIMLVRMLFICFYNFLMLLLFGGFRVIYFTKIWTFQVPWWSSFYMHGFQPQFISEESSTGCYSGISFFYLVCSK